MYGGYLKKYSGKNSNFFVHLLNMNGQPTVLCEEKINKKYNFVG